MTRGAEGYISSDLIAPPSKLSPSQGHVVEFLSRASASDGRRVDGLDTTKKRRRASEQISAKRPLISVFGSSRAQCGDPLYRQGFQLGMLLGQAGFDVATGGYRGVMEATSRGARAAGAQVLGVTLSSFNEEVNPFVMRELRARNMYSRMKRLIDSSDGYVALRGGMGTLAEVTFVWQMLALSLMPAKPFVLLGKEWRAVLDCWVEYLTVVESDYDCLKVVEKPEDAVSYLKEWFSAHPLIAEAT